MAREDKQGLGYFPLDTDFSQDIKIKKIKARFGFIGKAIIVELFSNIYASKGYFMPWDEETAELLALDEGVELDLLNKVIGRAIEVNIFNQEMFETRKILTSKAIQKRYLQAAKSKRKTEYISEYLLIKDIDILDSIIRKSQNIKILNITSEIIKEFSYSDKEKNNENNDEKNDAPSVNGTLDDKNGTFDIENRANSEKLRSKIVNMKHESESESKNESESESESRERNGTEISHPPTHPHTDVLNLFIHNQAPNIKNKLGFLTENQVNFYLKKYSKAEMFQILSEINEHNECGRKYKNLVTTINKFLDAKYGKTA